MKTVAIGHCAMSWGDILEPGVEMAKKANIQYMAFDFLGEVTMSLLYRMRLRDPSRGYIPDIVPWHRALLPLARERGFKLVANWGGANPEAAGDAVVNLAKELGLTGLKVGVIVGDDFSDRIDEMRAKGIKFPNLDTGEEDLDRIKDKMAGAYAYIGADSVIEALKQGADTVIGGRLSDSACLVGPWMYEFGWDYKEPYWNKIGAAITCGHIVECSSSCTGGMMCSLWKDIPQQWNISDPICELNENGEAIITKTPSPGGLVNTWTVKEHLVYEIHDPRNYLMPDGIADFTTPHLEDAGENRVKVTNMSGKPRPDTLKVGIGYEEGWRQEAQQWFCWPDALEKAKRAEFNLREWIKHDARLNPVAMQVDYMGFNMLHGSVVKVPEPKDVPDLPEVGLRVCAKFNTREEADYFRREWSRWTGFDSGFCFNTTAAPSAPARIIALWPTLVPREEIPTRVIMKEVK